MGYYSKASLDVLLNEKFTSFFRPGYTQCKGFTLPIRYEDFKQEIDEFEVFDDDIWVCSFPKTGTTWSQEMIWLIANDCDYKMAEVNLGARFPFLEVSMVFDFRSLKMKHENFVDDQPIWYENSVKFVREAKRPRFIKTHLPWDLLPRQIRHFERHPKIIYVTRNPKQVCVSYFHHVGLLEGFSGNFNEFVELFLSGKITFGPFWKNVLPFWHRRNDPNFLFIKYEEMKSDLGSVVDKTAQFLGKILPETQKSELLHRLSFESMKSNPSVNYESIIEFHRKWASGLLLENGNFMRQGGLKLEMTKDDEDRFDSWIRENDPHHELTY